MLSHQQYRHATTEQILVSAADCLLNEKKLALTSCLLRLRSTLPHHQVKYVAPQSVYHCELIPYPLQFVGLVPPQSTIQYHYRVTEQIRSTLPVAQVDSIQQYCVRVDLSFVLADLPTRPHLHGRGARQN